MTFHIITLFPEVFDAYFKKSIIGKAIKERRIKVKLYDLREFSRDERHRKVDDKPYGGGPGMVLAIEPIVRAIRKAIRGKKNFKIILLSASGEQFNNKMAESFMKYKHIVLIAGRYEGVDERIKKIFSTNMWKTSGGRIEEISIGPYVLTGGEIPAMVVVDAVSRQIKGVLGKEESLEEKRYGVGVPVYTRPEIFKYKGKEYKVPKVLLSGDHKKIDEWRKGHKKQIPNSK